MVFSDSVVGMLLPGSPDDVLMDKEATFVDRRATRVTIFLSSSCSFNMLLYSWRTMYRIRLVIFPSASSTGCAETMSTPYSPDQLDKHGAAFPPRLPNHLAQQNRRLPCHLVTSAQRPAPEGQSPVGSTFHGARGRTSSRLIALASISRFR